MAANMASGHYSHLATVHKGSPVRCKILKLIKRPVKAGVTERRIINPLPTDVGPATASWDLGRRGTVVLRPSKATDDRTINAEG